MKNKFKYTRPLLFFTLICILIVIVDIKGTEYLLSTIPKIPYGDKLAHFGIFGILAFLFNRALAYKQIIKGTFHWQFGALIVLAFAIIEEFSQVFLSTRSFDFFDILADYLGIWLFSISKTRNLDRRILAYLSGKSTRTHGTT
ncbi:MAG: VanZ family protein [Cyclobacteriaceae bacterium]